MLSSLKSSRLYERISRYENVKTFVKYSMIGGLNVVIFLGIFNLMRRVVGLDEVPSYVIAFVPTNINSFFLNKRWAFRDERRHAVGRQYLLFAFFTVVSLGIQTGLFQLFLIPLQTYGWLGENIAALLPLPFSVAWNFASYRLWAFKRAEPIPEGARAPVS